MARWLVALVVGLAACSNSTGPSNPPDVSGTWQMGMSLFTSGLDCSFSPIMLSLTQSGLTFTGTHTGSTVTCVDNADGQSVSAEIPAGTVINGTISVWGGSASAPVYLISFDLDTPDANYTVRTRLGLFDNYEGSQKVDFGAPRGVTILQGGWSWAKQ